METLTTDTAPGRGSELRAASGPELCVRAVESLDRVGRAIGWEGWQGERTTQPRATTELVALACGILADRIASIHDDGASSAAVPELCSLLVELEDVRRALHELSLAERYEALVGVQSGLGRLRGIDSVSAIIDQATAEVCRSCGFDRAIMFQVLDARMVAVSVYDERDDAAAAAILLVGRDRPAELTHMLLETEMVRRRIPMLVPDAQGDERVHRAIAEASRSRAYVAAPIMPEGRVIGFLHADRYYQDRDVDAFDRDVLWAFAEGFGYAYERTVLLERMRQQRDQVRGMIASTEALIDELCDAGLEASEITHEPAPAAGRAASILTSGSSRVDQLLTRREIEVMALMAAGETNAGIADRLVITEGTAKSHVKHILRKLRAANRAEAVSRYLRIVALDSSD